MSNAIKYAPGKPVHISLETKHGQACLKVQDFGPGVAKEKQAKLFECFERAVSARNVSGLGLGLFISKQIIKAHGGELSLWSERAKGSTFTITLPLYRVAKLNGVILSTETNPREEIAT